MKFKVGDKVRIKNICWHRESHGKIGTILAIDESIKLKMTRPCEFVHLFVEEKDVEPVDKSKPHICGLICKKCKPREAIEF